jgi:hypothetical protein
MELELAKSYLTELREKKKQAVESAKEMEVRKCRKWMKNRGKK